MNAPYRRFHSYALSGLAAAAAPGADGRLAVQVGVELNGQSANVVRREIQLYGPGDVVGVDPRAIVRTDPAPGTLDFEASRLVLLELEPAELPWMFTPEQPTKGRLRPWLALVVLEDGAEATLEAGDRLPRLHVAEPGALPDPGRAWAWAHVQTLVPGAGAGASAGSSPADESAAAPAGMAPAPVARLLCPRRLRPGTHYIACLVPLFQAGVDAGFGRKATGTGVAWGGADAKGPIDLCVYYHWTFATGAAGDFEALVRRLRPRSFPPGAGRRPMEVAPIEAGQAAFTLDLEGALVPPGGTATGPQAGPGAATGGPQSGASTADELKAYRDALRPLLQSGITPQGAGATPPVLGPPIYGAAHADESALQPASGWLAELNLDPVRRAAAGLGARVVQTLQDHLVAAAWRQVGELREATAALGRTQLARELGRRLHARLAALPDARLFQLAAPVRSRVRVAAGRTLLKEVEDSALPQSVGAVTWRRALRPHGRLLRGSDAGSLLDGLVGGLAAATLRPMSAWQPDTLPSGSAPGKGTPGGTGKGAGPGPVRMPLPPGGWGAWVQATGIGLDYGGVAKRVTGPRVRGLLGSLPGLSTPPTPPGQTPPPHVPSGPPPHVPSGPPPHVPSVPPPRVPPVKRGEAGGAGGEGPHALQARVDEKGIQTRLRSELAALAAHVAEAEQRLAALERPRPAFGLSDAASALRGALLPDVALKDRIWSRLRGAGARPAQRDDLDPLLGSPEFGQPMSRELVRLAHELLVPGLQQVPQNTVTVLRTNPEFVASFLIGLNHEMSRELLWRRFPANLRSTFFRRFWDAHDPATGEPLPDIARLDGLSSKADLGSLVTGGEHFVLLLRGDLVRRHPRAAFYLAPPASGAAGPDVARARQPIFRGGLEPDVLFVGFDVEPAMARTWFVVLQEQPTEPRFGVHATGGAGPAQGAGSSSGEVTWAGVAANAADTAALLLHHPLRVAIPVQLLMPSNEGA